MAETDNNMQAGSVDNSLKMRNTETAALKRMPVSANSASASAAARKTIKLKPLVSSTGSSPGAPAGPSSSPRVAPPSILLNRKPAAQPADQTPKFMSTNTAPIIKMAKPNAEKPVQTADLNAGAGAASPAADMTKTVSIPRFQNRGASAVKAASSPAMPSVPTASGGAAASSPAVPTATVITPKMPRPAASSGASAPKVPAATGTMPKISAITGALPKVSRPTAGAVKPAYISTATTMVPKSGAPAPVPVATVTQGIQKQAINQAKMQSGLQEAKPAIKLRPSASPDASPENLTPASPTIKLSPKTESTVSPMPSTAEESASASPAPANAAAEEAAPAGNASSSSAAKDVTVTTRISRPKLQLRSNASSSPAAEPQQAKLREQGDIANKLKDQSAQEENQTITQSEDESENAAPAARKKQKGGDEPNVVFAICAILAFLVIGYTVFALTAQYLNTWEQQKIPVVGFEQIDKSLKK